MNVQPVALENRFVRLEPLAETHRDGLRLAGAGDAEAYRFVAAVDGPEFDSWFDWSLKERVRGTMLPFAVRRLADGALVGSTRYLNIDAANKRLEIGYTWYARDAWGGAVNPSCKRLLIGHAFETLGANRVELKCDARNARSRAAILKLGATQEGILRKHMVVRDGYVRDTVMFSIVAEEWPRVRDGLDARLAGGQ